MLTKVEFKFFAMRLSSINLFLSFLITWLFTTRRIFYNFETAWVIAVVVEFTITNFEFET